MSSALALQKLRVLSECEDLPMTMQVGMVGTDGILLASDTRWTDQSEGTWYPYRSTKIVADNAAKIAVAVSRQRTPALEIAERIIADFKGQVHGNPELRFRRIAEEKLRELQNMDIQCLIILGFPTLRLFNLRYSVAEGRWAPIRDCGEVKDCIPAGDTKNAALLFATHYYRKMPLSDLSFVAAHTIFSGSRLSNGNIGGLEMMECRPEGFSLLTEAKLEKLESWSKRVDEEIGGLLYGSPTKFHERPLV